MACVEVKINSFRVSGLGNYFRGPVVVVDSRAFYCLFL